jgi:hypothetical protein
MMSHVSALPLSVAYRPRFPSVLSPAPSRHRLISRSYLDTFCNSSAAAISSQRLRGGIGGASRLVGVAGKTSAIVFQTFGIMRNPRGRGPPRWGRRRGPATGGIEESRVSRALKVGGEGAEAPLSRIVSL